MFKRLKKILTTKSTIKLEVKNQELIDRLHEVIYIDDLDEILFSPINRLYMINTYNHTFEDFLNNLLTKKERSLIAVNIYSYFKEKKNISYKLKRIIPILEQNEISINVQYELNEIIDAIEYLRSLGG